MSVQGNGGTELADRWTDRFFGKYRGFVTANEDKKKLGRIKAKVPEVLHDLETGWALPCFPYAGPNAGAFAIPPIGAGVWIEFEAGFVYRPVWTGCFLGDGDVPKNHKGAQATSKIKILRSDNGLLLAFDDDGQTVTLSDSQGNNIVTIEVQSGAVSAKGASKVELEAPLIKHGQGAAQSAVLGDLALDYLNQLVLIYNAHVHPGEMALGVFPVVPTPPLGPFPTAPQMLLSTKVKVE